MAPTVAELQGQLNAALSEVVKLKSDVALLTGQGTSKPVVVLRYDAIDDVELRTVLSEVPHQVTNPVQRPTGSATTCLGLDLGLERGMLAVKKAPFATQVEYKRWAPMVSYLFDAVMDLERQCSSSDVPEERRKSIAVVLTHLREVLGYSTTQLDLLKLKGERANAPEVVDAVVQAVQGHHDLPISSPAVQAALTQVSHLSLLASMKAAAKAQSRPLNVHKESTQE